MPVFLIPSIVSSLDDMILEEGERETENEMYFTEGSRGWPHTLTQACQ